MTDADRGKLWPAALGRIPSGLFILTASRGGQEFGGSSLIPEVNFRITRRSCD